MHVAALALQFLVWEFLLLLFALPVIGPLVSAIRDDPRPLEFSRRDWLFLGLFIVICVGNAVSGSGFLPPVERVAAGVAVVLVVSTFAATLLRLRWRRRQTEGASARDPQPHIAARTGSPDDAATSSDHAGSTNAADSTATAPASTGN